MKRGLSSYSTVLRVEFGEPTPYVLEIRSEREPVILDWYRILSAYMLEALEEVAENKNNDQEKEAREKEADKEAAVIGSEVKDLVETANANEDSNTNGDDDVTQKNAI